MAEVERKAAGGAWTFLRQFTRRPKDVGSVVPSSIHLARALVGAAGLENHHSILELGAGTGAITTAILSSVPDANLLSFEPNPDLAAILRRRFSGLRVVVEYAGSDLPEVLERYRFGPVDRVVSALPWAAWDEATQSEIFDGIVSAMAPDGRFVTYSYLIGQVLPSHRSLKAQMDRRFRRVVRTKPLWANFPPASVFICEDPIRD